MSSQVVPATCALTCLLLPHRRLSLSSNQLTSLAGVTFPASLTCESPSPIESLESRSFALAVVVHPHQTVFPLKCAASVNRCYSGDCHMCVDMADDASQEPRPRLLPLYAAAPSVSGQFFALVRIGRSSCEERMIPCTWILMFQYPHTRAHTG